MAGRRVLVVDDDVDTVVYLTALLEDNGHQVSSAPDAETAAAELERFPVDTVLMDVMMPGRSGLDLLVRLRRDPRWREIRVIVVTGNDQVVQDGGKSYLSLHDGVRGADAVLGKPIDPEALLGLLAS
jgi:CheY-like chemotaxis protein